MALADSFGRTMTKMRVSVTDRCDLRCTYCMPAEGLDWLPKVEILSFEDITRLVEVAVGEGIRKVRLTGGEPLVRRELPVLVGMLRAVPGLVSIGMTTNGIQLASQAEALKAAGLGSVNVSLDSLDRERFHQLTRRDALDRVLEGLAAASRVFPGKVKVNAVSLRGLTEDEVVGFVELARREDLMIRFIEFMPLDADEGWQASQVLSGRELLERVKAVAPLEPAPVSGPSSPAVEYRFVGGRGGVGFINSVTEPFCGACDRIRVTADGRLRTCLFSHRETNLRELLRQGSREELARVLREAVWAKEAGHRIGELDFSRASRSMSQIGG